MTLPCKTVLAEKLPRPPGHPLLAQNEVLHAAEIIGLCGPAGNQPVRLGPSLKHRETLFVVPQEHRLAAAASQPAADRGILAQWSGVTDQPHLWIIARQLVRNLAGGVGRAIVDDQQFKWFARVCHDIEDFVHVLVQGRLGVLYRQQDGNRALHKRVLSCREIRLPRWKYISAAVGDDNQSDVAAGRLAGRREADYAEIPLSIGGSDRDIVKNI